MLILYQPLTVPDYDTFFLWTILYLKIGPFNRWEKIQFLIVLCHTHYFCSEMFFDMSKIMLFILFFQFQPFLSMLHFSSTFFEHVLIFFCKTTQTHFKILMKFFKIIVWMSVQSTMYNYCVDVRAPRTVIVWMSIQSTTYSYCVDVYIEHHVQLLCGCLYRAPRTVIVWMSIQSTTYSYCVDVYIEHHVQSLCGCLYRAPRTVIVWMSIQSTTYNILLFLF